MVAKSGSKLSLGEKAYELIREQIITLKLRPGEQIDESRLATLLAIGRTPIREALQRLARDKLLDSVPGRGFSVKSISIDNIKELFEALTILERVAVHLASQRISEKQIQQLSDLHSLHKEAMSKKEFRKVTVFNSKIHRTIYQAVCNDFLQTSLDSIYDQAERLTYLTFTEEADPQGMFGYNEKAVQEHEDLIQYFKTSNSDKAVELITAHSKQFFLRVCHYMEPRINPLETFVDSSHFMNTA